MQLEGYQSCTEQSDHPCDFLLITPSWRTGERERCVTELGDLEHCSKPEGAGGGVGIMPATGGALKDDDAVDPEVG